MMTFNYLHYDLSSSCNCVATHESREVSLQTYGRRVQNISPSIADFYSYQEERGNPRFDECGKICDWRGVSINLITDENEQLIILEWRSMISHKPKIKSKIYCKFKLKENVALTVPSPVDESASGKSHFTLLKSDNFCFCQIDIIEVTSLI